MDIFRSFGKPVYQFGCRNSCAQKTVFKFFSLVVFQKKEKVEVAINDSAMQLIISKWLRIHKCRQKRITMREKGRKERRNCQQKCFHSFNYAIDHASISLFFYINSLHCSQFTFLLYYLLHLLSSNCLAALTILQPYKFFI